MTVYLAKDSTFVSNDFYDGLYAMEVARLNNKGNQTQSCTYYPSTISIDTTLEYLACWFELSVNNCEDFLSADFWIYNTLNFDAFTYFDKYVQMKNRDIFISSLIEDRDLFVRFLRRAAQYYKENYMVNGDYNYMNMYQAHVEVPAINYGATNYGIPSAGASRTVTASGSISGSGAGYGGGSVGSGGDLARALGGGGGYSINNNVIPAIEKTVKKERTFKDRLTDELAYSFLSEVNTIIATLFKENAGITASGEVEVVDDKQVVVITIPTQTIEISFASLKDKFPH